MYYAYCDGNLIYDPSDQELNLLSPELDLKDNAAGSFSFTIFPAHEAYDILERMSSTVAVFRDDTQIFEGRITEETTGFYKRKKIYCEGCLSYLNDTIQPPAEYHDITVRGFLEKLIAIHNSKAAGTRQFKVGIVTVRDSNDSLYRYTNYETTLECINEKLIKVLGGHLRVRWENEVTYLDYLEYYPNTNTQTIEFGENLLDFTRNFDMTDIATVIVPRGTRLDESPIEALDAYLTVSSVNNGSIYVKSDAAIANYGWIERVVDWPDVTDASNLLKKAKAYLSDIQYENMVLELKAVDLHLLDADEEAIYLLDRVRAVSEPHGLDRYFPVTELKIPLDAPDQAVFTLGTKVQMSLTSANNEANAELLQKIQRLPTESHILEQAKTNASELIRQATNGHVVVKPDELLIMNTDDPDTATLIWRWNLNGLGYTDEGYDGTYGTAITMDGQIVADCITTGTMYANRIKGGTLTLGGAKNANGVLTIKNASGTVIGRWDKDGINATNGTFNGTLTNVSGDQKTVIDNARMNIYKSDQLVGYVDGNTYYKPTGVYGTRIGGKGLIALLTPYMGVGSYVESGDVFVDIGGSGVMNYVADLSLSTDASGRLNWSYHNSYVVFYNGLMVTDLDA